MLQGVGLIASNQLDCGTEAGVESDNYHDGGGAGPEPPCSAPEARDFTVPNSGACTNAGDNLGLRYTGANGNWDLFAAPVGSPDVDYGLVIGFCTAAEGCNPDAGGDSGSLDSVSCPSGLGANFMVSADYNCVIRDSGKPPACPEEHGEGVMMRELDTVG